MTRKSLRAALLVLVAATAAGSALYRYTFPPVSNGAHESGILAFERQWWEGTSLVSLDMNHDGLVDSRLRFPGLSGYYSTHLLPVESWEDFDFNGSFEAHILYVDNQPNRIELDDDGDGRLDRALENDAARRFLAERRGHR